MKTIGPGRPRGSGWEFSQEVLSSFNTLIMPRWFYFQQLTSMLVTDVGDSLLTGFDDRVYTLKIPVVVRCLKFRL